MIHAGAISTSTRSMWMGLASNELLTTTLSMASQCFRLMGRSWSSLQIATLRNPVIRMSSLPTGSTNVRYALACRRLGIGITRALPTMKNKVFTRYLFTILLVAISTAVLAQQQSFQTDPSAAKLRQHISYLASDALEGRRTGSAGANDAAHYIAGEFSRLGLRPAVQKSNTRKLSGAMSRYLQTFPYIAGVQLGKGNALSFNQSSRAAPLSLGVGDDWMPLGFSTNGRVDRTATVFVGFGITSAELNYNDYQAADVAANG